MRVLFPLTVQIMGFEPGAGVNGVPGIAADRRRGRRKGGGNGETVEEDRAQARDGFFGYRKPGNGETGENRRRRRYLHARAAP